MNLVSNNHPLNNIIGLTFRKYFVVTKFIDSYTQAGIHNNIDDQYSSGYVDVILNKLGFDYFNSSDLYQCVLDYGITSDALNILKSGETIRTHISFIQLNPMDLKILCRDLSIQKLTEYAKTI